MRHFGSKSAKGLLPLITASSSTAILLAFAMPGRFGWWPLLFFALVPLLSCIANERPRRSFFAGFLAGFLYHVFLLYWIVIVLGRYGGLPLWLAVPVMLLLAGYMGVYLGLFSGILSLAFGKGRRKRHVPSGMMLFAPVLWVGLDWLRGMLLSGFPWMDLGYGLYSQPVMIQIADLGGHHLVTFSLVLLNTLLYFLLNWGGSGNRQTARSGPRIAAGVSLLLIFFAVYSLARYRQMDTMIRGCERKTVAVVQGNIPQDEKWTPAGKQKTLDIYKRLSRQGIREHETGLIVWPETALPFYPGNDPLYFSVTGFAKKENIWLLTGSPYFTIDEGVSGTGPVLRYFNSALLINPEGQVTGRYSKQHLVPFGEYVPLSRFLPFLEPIVVHVGNFTPGNSNVPLRLGEVKAGILICFESIFADLARKQVQAGANVLVNLTNDAWYGRSSAPHQSFAMSIFRSVETRRSLIRAANTGISGFVDPLGRVMGKSALFEPLVLTAAVPLVEKQSLFSRFGYSFAPACMVLTPLLFFLLRRRR